MTKRQRRPRRLLAWRCVIEISGIVFLFYSNLLMGEFNASNGAGKTMMAALRDIFTGKNFAIAMVSSSVGFVVFEYFRMRLDRAEGR